MGKTASTVLFIITLIAFIGFEYYSILNVVGLGDSSIRNFSKLAVEGIACLFIMTAGLKPGLNFWFLWMCWAIFSSLFFSNEIGIGRYVTLWFPQAAFFVGYYCCRNKVNVMKWLILATIILIVIGSYFMLNNVALLAVAMEVRSADNLVFYLVCLIPFVLLFKNKILKIILLVVILGMTVFSLKRSAMIMVLVIVTAFVYDLIRNQKKNKFWNAIIVSVILIFGYHYLTDNAEGSIERNIERFESISEDKGSGRDRLWKDMMVAISNNDLLEWIFGHGNKGTMKAARHTSGHNDILTVLLEQGMIGLSFYLTFVFKVFEFYCKMRKIKSPHRLSAFSILTIVVVMGAISNLVPLASYFAFITLALGIMEWDYSEKRKAKV